MPDYQPGDIVQTRRTLEITRRFADGYTAVDVQDESLKFYLPNAGNGSLRVEMVRKAPRMSKGTKPKAGTILKGSSVQRIWWKRGTIIRVVVSDSGRPVKNGTSIVLSADGTWINLNDPALTTEFEDLNPNAKFLLEHVA